MRRLKRTLVLLLLGAACIALALVLRRHAPLPFAWAFPVFGIGCMALCLAIPGAAAQYAGIGLLSLSLALGGGEAYLNFQEQSQGHADAGDIATAQSGASVMRPGGEEKASGEERESYRRYTENGRNSRPTVPNAVTGYSPKPSSAVRAVEVKNGRLIYDVVYTINEQGWRVTPQHPQAAEAVVFFGCSYAFGDAINDAETFPWQTAELLGEKYQVYNFAFSGFGPHQFLALLESGALDAIASKHSKTHVFFSSILGHEYRSSGYHNWVADAPWYEIVGDRPIRQGVFADKSGSFRVRADRFFEKSKVYALFFRSAHGTFDHAHSVALQHALFKEGVLLCRALPDTDFAIILWPGGEYNEPFLHAEGISALKLAEAFPADYTENKKDYIVVGNGHPNGYANSFVAACLAAYIRGLSDR